MQKECALVQRPIDKEVKVKIAKVRRVFHSRGKNKKTPTEPTDKV